MFNKKTSNYEKVFMHALGDYARDAYNDCYGSYSPSC